MTAEQVAQARAAAAALQGREPTAEELEALVEPTVRDEVMYREALALGLDVNDDEVRRRLIEKMSYLTQDLADPEPSSEEALRQFYEASPDLFTIPALVSFDQVFFSPGARGAALDADAAAGLAALRVRSRAGRSRRSHAAARVVRRRAARASCRAVRRRARGRPVRRRAWRMVRARSAPTSACTPCGCATAPSRGCRRTTRSPRASPKSTARAPARSQRASVPRDARALRRRHRVAARPEPAQ